MVVANQKKIHCHLGGKKAKVRKEIRLITVSNFNIIW